ncbi:hypothetical protein ACFQZJ_08865 [Maribacter chungangensis]|uniref:LVIVD repeat-containing protein n=1 Tax=Maribacter chungangensis TaxID=1069117 RepID=A0ABW3B4L9_9FLAO
MKKLPLSIILFALALSSCSDETTVFENPDKSDIRMETNETLLENSVLFDKAGVLDIYDEENIAGKSYLSGKNDLAGDYPLTLVAQIDVPSFSGGANLTASHVDVSGSYAYVSYNTADAGYVGGIDVINVSDPTNPRVTARLYYVNADINSIKYDNGYIYIAGGVDSEKSVTATANSFVAKLQTFNGRINVDAGIVYAFQEGYNATDIAVTSSEVLVTSGREGFVSTYNKADLTPKKQAPFMDLRSVAVQDNRIAVLDASQGISILDSDLNTVRDIPIDSDFGNNTKRTLDFSGENIVVAEGSKGAGVYNSNTGSFIQYVPILLSPDNVDGADVVTNAVATNKEALLMANGGAGLCLSEEQQNSTDLVGIIQLEGSINYVASKDDYIFAASGKEGLQIIKLNRPEESLVARCADLSAYRGSSNLSVNTNQNLAYRGAKRFNNFNVSGTLLLCGSWTVRNGVNLNSDSLFEMNGTFVVGRNNNRKNINVNGGATLRVEGNLTIYGDLNLNDGASIEFVGENSVVNIFGTVNRNGSTSVKGSFRDIKNKF